MKILVAEDSSFQREHIAKIFQAYGEVVTVENGREAVNAFQAALEINEPYDLICLDIVMPILSGTKALDAIRRIEKEKNSVRLIRVKIVMLTSQDDADSVVSSHLSGCNAYLLKPINKAELDKKLQELQLI